MKFRAVFRYRDESDHVSVHIYVVDDFHGSRRLGGMELSSEEFNQLRARFPAEFRELPAIAA